MRIKVFVKYGKYYDVASINVDEDMYFDLLEYGEVEYSLVNTPLKDAIEGIFGGKYKEE